MFSLSFRRSIDRSKVHDRNFELTFSNLSETWNRRSPHPYGEESDPRSFETMNGICRHTWIVDMRDKILHFSWQHQRRARGMTIFSVGTQMGVRRRNYILPRRARKNGSRAHGRYSHSTPRAAVSRSATNSRSCVESQSQALALAPWREQEIAFTPLETSNVIDREVVCSAHRKRRKPRQDGP